MQHDERLIVRTSASPYTVGSGRCGVRKHYALATDTHISKALRRLHRVSWQSAGHVLVSPRRTCTVRTAVGQHETGIQRQEETHVPCKRTLRVTRARRGDAVQKMMNGRTHAVIIVVRSGQTVRSTALNLEEIIGEVTSKNY